jgi:hypothetical protein
MKKTATNTIKPTTNFDRILSFLLSAKVGTRLSSPPIGVNEKKPQTPFEAIIYSPKEESQLNYQALIKNPTRHNKTFVKGLQEGGGGLGGQNGNRGQGASRRAPILEGQEVLPP